MKQLSAADSPSFRALDGSEFLEVLTEHIKLAAAEVLSKADGKFSGGRAYPVASVNAVIRIALYHDTRQTEPYKSVDVPLRFWTFVRPDEAISGLQSVISEDVKFSFNVGRDIASAPDALRENHALVVLQPQKRGAMVSDEPVVAAETYPRECECGKTVKSKQGYLAHRRFWCSANPGREAHNPEDRVNVTSQPATTT